MSHFCIWISFLYFENIVMYPTLHHSLNFPRSYKSLLDIVKSMSDNQFCFFFSLSRHPFVSLLPFALIWASCCCHSEDFLLHYHFHNPLTLYLFCVASTASGILFFLVYSPRGTEHILLQRRDSYAKLRLGLGLDCKLASFLPKTGKGIPPWTWLSSINSEN